MTKNEVLKYVHGVIYEYAQKEEFSHTIWDFYCDTLKLLDWLQECQMNDSEFCIAIRHQGVECGDSEYVAQRCKHLGKSVHSLAILYRYDTEIFDGDFQIVEL